MISYIRAATCGGIALLVSACATAGVETVTNPEQRAWQEGVNHEYAYNRDTSRRANNAMACGSAQLTRCNWVWSHSSRGSAEREALAQCQREVGAPCFTFATNNARTAWATSQGQ
jgi:hypothetical protein